MKAYIVNINMLNMEPLVWRKVIFPAKTTFQKLHAIIQDVTNFQSSYMPMTHHFHEFRLPEENLLVTDEPIVYEESKGKKKGQLKVRKPQSLKIDAYLEQNGKLDYTYDFGDNWQFEITLEEIVEDYHFGYPTVLDGAGDAPPEDVGGIQGFLHLQEVLADPKHPEYEHLLWWSQEQRFNSYDRRRLNGRLTLLKMQKTEWDKIRHDNYAIISDKYLVDPPEEDTPYSLPVGIDTELFYAYVRACTNLYGVVPEKHVVSVFNRQNPKMFLKLNDIIELIISSDWTEKTHGTVLKSGLDFIHSSLQNAGKAERIAAEQAGKDWYVPAKDELLRYANESYLEKTFAYEDLKKVLTPYYPKLHPKNAEGAIRDFARDLQTDASFNTALGAMLSDIVLDGADDVNKIAQKAINFANNQRLWANCGHAPRELSGRKEPVPLANVASTPEESIVKQGRNDPCECGSGKKYKKCCGKGY